MHALRHVHGLLVSGGTLVDLHPVTEQRVEAGGRLIGVIEEREWLATVLPNAETRLREAIRDKLYALEAEVEFDLLQNFDTGEELIEAESDLLELQPVLRDRIRKVAPPLALRERYVGRRLRAC